MAKHLDDGPWFSRRVSFLNANELQAGELGFEPRQADPESAVLPLHHSPKAFAFARQNSRLGRGPRFGILSWFANCDKSRETLRAGAQRPSRSRSPRKFSRSGMA